MHTPAPLSERGMYPADACAWSGGNHLARPSGLPSRDTSRAPFVLCGILALATTVAADVTIENGRLNVRVDPERGGQVTVVDGASRPMLVDTLVLPGRRRVSLGDLQFKIDETTRTPAECTLTAAFADLGDAVPQELRGVVLHKRFRMRESAPVLDVEYELRNTGQTPVAVCLASTLVAATEPEKNTLCVPTAQGTARFPHKAKSLLLYERTSGHLYDGAGAWAALTGAGSGALIVSLDPRHLSFLSVDTEKQSAELVRTVLTVPPGKAARTTGEIMLCPQAPVIDGVAPGVAAWFSVEPSAAGLSPAHRRATLADRLKREAARKQAGPAAAADGDDLLGELVEELTEEQGNEYTGDPIRVTLSLLGHDMRNLQIRFSAMRNPHGAWRRLSDRTVHLGGGKPVSTAVDLKPDQPGTWIVRAEVLDADGAEIARFEQPVDADQPTGFCFATPSPKEGVVNDDFHQPVKLDYERADWTPSLAVRSSHRALATPLADGPVKALFVIPYWPSRGVVEIAQRLDIEFDCVIAGRNYEVEGNEVATAREIERLRRLLNRKHDVIMFALLQDRFFPVDVMDEVFRQVRDEGVGLVLHACPNKLGLFDPLRENCKQRMYSFVGDAALTGQFGKGRIVLVEGEAKYMRPDWVGRTEQDCQELARHVFWAARGDPAVRIADSAQPERVDRGSLRTSQIAVALSTSGSEFAGTVRLTPCLDLPATFDLYRGVPRIYHPMPLWTASSRSVEQPLRIAADSRKRVAFSLPAIPAGSFDLDVTVHNASGAVVGWRTLPLTVTSAQRIGDITLARDGGPPVRFPATGDGRTFVATHEQVLTAMCSLDNPPDNARVRLEGVEPWGRTVFESEEPVAGETVTFTQPLHSALHMTLLLRFSLLDADGPVHERHIRMFVEPREDRFPKFELRGYTEPRIQTEVAGWDVRTGGESPDHLAWFNLRKSDYGSWVPMAKTVITPFDEKVAAPTAPGGAVDDGLLLEEKTIDPRDGWIRVPCLLDPEFREQRLKAVENAYRRTSLCSPFQGFAVDEFFYCKEGEGEEWRGQFIPSRDLNTCRCPNCLEAFREFVRDLFEGDAARLNSAWGTQLTAWEEIEPPFFQPDSIDPPPESEWPRILAHRQFIDRQVAEFFGDIRAAVERGRRGCRTGMSGMWKTSIQNGLDIYQLAQHCRYNMLYTDLELWADFGDVSIVKWYGYDWQHNYLNGSNAPWQWLFRGLDAVGYYSKQSMPLWRADFTFLEEPAALFREMKWIKETGVDRLLVGHRQRDPVVLYYDPLNVYTAQLEEWQEDPTLFIKHMWKAGRGHQELNHMIVADARQMLARNSLQHQWIAYADLEAGRVCRFGTPRLLILPYAQCLSEAQADTLRDYVARGGVLVGDIHTGMRDRYGRVLDKGRLDDVFGIRCEGQLRARRRHGTDGKPVVVRFAGAGGDEAFEVAFPAVGADDLRPAGAEALATYELDGSERPAFLVNRLGKGVAVYLNFIPASSEDKAAGKGLAEVYSKLLALAELKSPIVCEEDVPVRRFNDGDLIYVGVRAGTNPAALAREYHLRMDKPRHVVNVRDGEYVGLVDRFPVQFDEKARRVAALFSALPYRVGSVDAKLAQPGVKRGDVLRFTASLSPADARKNRHVVAVRVFGPDGEPRPRYAFSTETRNGQARGDVGTATSDPPGEWHLELTDVSSGVRTTVPFRLE